MTDSQKNTLKLPKTPCIARQMPPVRVIITYLNVDGGPQMGGWGPLIWGKFLTISMDGWVEISNYIEACRSDHKLNPSRFTKN